MLLAVGANNYIRMSSKPRAKQYIKLASVCLSHSQKQREDSISMLASTQDKKKINSILIQVATSF
jgi:hypothetical protein